MIPSTVVCLDCDGPRLVTRFGTCATCGSASVLRVHVHNAPWWAAPKQHPKGGR